MMKPQIMFCLVGEQPVPNFVPIKSLDPQKVVLLYSDFTQKRAELLGSLLKHNKIEKKEFQIEPYRLDTIIKELEEIVKEEKIGGYDGIIFNLTGGTKPMSLAAYHLCMVNGIPHCYLQSEGRRSLLHIYRMKEEKWHRDTTKIDSMITIDEYLKLYFGDYDSRDGDNKFEKAVYEALQDSIDEIACNILLGPSLEIDLVLRHGNKMGIAEIKTGRTGRSKEGIDQLNTAAGREYLGTYINKFLIIDSEYPENNMLLAQARNIHVIELTKSNKEDCHPEVIHSEDKEKLRETILQEMS